MSSSRGRTHKVVAKFARRVLEEKEQKNLRPVGKLDCTMQWSELFSDERNEILIR